MMGLLLLSLLCFFYPECTPGVSCDFVSSKTSALGKDLSSESPKRRKQKASPPVKRSLFNRIATPMQEYWKDSEGNKNEVTERTPNSASKENDTDPLMTPYWEQPEKPSPTTVQFSMNASIDTSDVFPHGQINASVSINEQKPEEIEFSFLRRVGHAISGFFTSSEETEENIPATSDSKIEESLAPNDELSQVHLGHSECGCGCGSDEKNEAKPKKGKIRSFFSNVYTKVANFFRSEKTEDSEDDGKNSQKSCDATACKRKGRCPFGFDKGVSAEAKPHEEQNKKPNEQETSQEPSLTDVADAAEEIVKKGKDNLPKMDPIANFTDKLPELPLANTQAAQLDKNTSFEFSKKANADVAKQDSTLSSSLREDENLLPKQKRRTPAWVGIAATVGVLACLVLFVCVGFAIRMRTTSRAKPEFSIFPSSLHVPLRRDSSLQLGSLREESMV